MAVTPSPWAKSGILHMQGRGHKYPLYLDAHQAVIPHPAKRQRGGEDAAFCSTRCLVVADGVGGWESSGVDAGLYSKELVKRIAAAVDEGGEAAVYPLIAMKKAFLATHAVGSWPSSKTIVARSEFQCHAFNFPLQLGTGSKDLPEHSHLLTAPTEPGDILFVATDGVWDNLFDEQVLEQLASQPDPAVRIL
ncbi:protein phosphatase [Cyclospora cayetanensis]|uniref:Protein phosphatase n=1 Tax=Cyclospora cayetanensis TaxID=88456 RepID=A0A1D3CZB0_9EIME|nr:protein phosphatase [Cyclospora cayetanensis]